MTCRRERERRESFHKLKGTQRREGTTQSKKEEDGGIRASPAHLFHPARILIVLLLTFLFALRNDIFWIKHLKKIFFRVKGEKRDFWESFSCIFLPQNQVVSPLNNSETNTCQLRLRFFSTCPNFWHKRVTFRSFFFFKPAFKVSDHNLILRHSLKPGTKMRFQTGQSTFPTDDFKPLNYWVPWFHPSSLKRERLSAQLTCSISLPRTGWFAPLF